METESMNEQDNAYIEAVSYTHLDVYKRQAEIKADMERPSPMDRLLCGDVGFGKTEVALRSAFKCIADGKQCAMLVPTTAVSYTHLDVYKRQAK